MKVLENERRYGYNYWADHDRRDNRPLRHHWASVMNRDLTAKKELPRLGPRPDQGRTSRCTGYSGATVLGLESHRIGADLQPSANGLYALARYAATAPGQPLEDTGASYHQVYAQAMKFGIPDERDCPSDADRVLDDIPFEGLIQAQGNLLQPRDWVTIDEDQGTARLDAIDHALEAGHPVGFARGVVRGFGTLRSDEMQGAGYEDYNEDFLGNHAMVVVGYDLQRDTYTIANSYGPYWGSAEAGPGYLYVKRRWLLDAFDLIVVSLLGWPPCPRARHSARTFSSCRPPSSGCWPPPATSTRFWPPTARPTARGRASVGPTSGAVVARSTSSPAPAAASRSRSSGPTSPRPRASPRRSTALASSPARRRLRPKVLDRLPRPWEWSFMPFAMIGSLFSTDGYPDGDLSGPYGARGSVTTDGPTQGPPGPAGPVGPVGLQGPPGRDGKDGMSREEVEAACLRLIEDRAGLQQYSLRMDFGSPATAYELRGLSDPTPQTEDEVWNRVVERCPKLAPVWRMDERCAMINLEGFAYRKSAWAYHKNKVKALKGAVLEAATKLAGRRENEHVSDEYLDQLSLAAEILGINYWSET